MSLNQHPGLAVLSRLRSGETVEIDNTGIVVKEIPGELQPGDDYVGARNTVNLLTVDRIEHGYVVPREIAYTFDLDECVKVEIVEC
jgi:hypothetical protein